MKTLFEIAVVLVAFSVAIVSSDYLLPANPIGTERFDRSTLKFVKVYSRHGSRSPFDTFPKDPCPFNDLRFWPDGVGRLTKAGKTQAYNLGRQLKSRYGGFVNNQFYYDNETIFQSNPLDRDLASSQLVAAGMYPPMGFQIWNADLLWQPIAVWIADYDVDETVYHCERFEVEREKVMNKLNEKYSRENKEFFREISNLTGLEYSEVPHMVIPLWHILHLAENNCAPIEWADTAFKDKLFPLAAESYRKSKVGNEVMTNLVAGPALEILVELLNKKTRGTLEMDRKIHILSGHDSTIVSLIASLGIDELLMPDPASSLIFELHNSTVAGHIVQVLYFNQSTTTVPTLFEIPSCPHPCSLVNFTRLAQKTITDGDRKYCVIQRNVSASETSVEIPQSSSATSLPSAAFIAVCILLRVIAITAM